MDYLGHIWNFLWFFFSIFVFVAYLMVLFSIFGDLFRDRELKGGWKALWIIFLLFIPLLTALAYLIFRGGGMAERNRRHAQAQKDAVDDYIREAAGTAHPTPAPATEIAQAKQLLDAGTISQDEFDTIKSHVIAHS